MLIRMKISFKYVSNKMYLFIPVVFKTAFLSYINHEW